MFTSKQNVAACVEWAIAFIFTFYALSFVLDLLPSVQSAKHVPQGVKEQEKRLEEGGHMHDHENNGYPADNSDLGGRKKRGFGRFKF